MHPLYIEDVLPPFFSAEQISKLDFQNIPSHVAIILDGNRRWAARFGGNATEGHREGADILLEIIRAAKELSISTLTVYCFSTENWSRPSEEVAMLLWLIEQYACQQRAQMLTNGVRVRYIGDLATLPISLQKELEETCRLTCECNEIEVVLAINYGGRNEICRAVNKIVKDVVAQKLSPEAITEEVISTYLDTKNLNDPALLIRPGGEFRLSNFLLWQTSYSELFFLDKMWPEFTPQDLYKAILSYQQRQRRLGF